MLTLISDLIFHRADTRNKDELFSVPGVCSYVVSFSSCDSAGRCAASPRCRGQHRPREGLLEATVTGGRSVRVETQVCL